jgi:hypothetical protein
LALAALLLCLAGCTRLLLAQLDWVAVWYVDGYFDLTPRQEAIVRDSVRRNVGTFRSRDLPDFLRVLAGIRADLGQAVTPAMVDRRIGELESLGQRAASLFVPASVVLLRRSTSCSRRWPTIPPSSPTSTRAARRPSGGRASRSRSASSSGG